MSVYEIAKRAGVSIATVSRVLNDNISVRPETAEVVRRAMEGYSYDRNAVRRGPRPGKRLGKQMGRIAIVVIGSGHEAFFRIPLFAAVVSSITRHAAGRGLSVVIDEALDAGSLSPTFQNREVDGAMAFIASFADPELVSAVRRTVPLVHVMGDQSSSTSIDQISPDNMAVGRIAYEHLVRQGCKNLAFVTTRPDHEPLYLRAIGFTAAACRAGNCHGEGSRPLQLVSGNVDAGPLAGPRVRRCDDLDAIADAIAAASPRIDGLFISQDLETIGLYARLARHGISPGKDLTIVSCNRDAAGGMLNPPPASIDLGADELGRLAVTRLVNRIAKPADAPMRILVTPTLAPATGASF